MLVIGTAGIICGRVYVSARCPSVCVFILSTAAAACGGFAAVGPAGRRYRSTAAAAAARRSAANASSVSLSADVGCSSSVHVFLLCDGSVHSAGNPVQFSSRAVNKP